MRVSFPQNPAKLGVRVSFLETLNFCAGGRLFCFRNPHKIAQSPKISRLRRARGADLISRVLESEILVVRFLFPDFFPKSY